MTLKQAFEIAFTYADADADKSQKALLCYYADIAQKEIALNVSPVTKRFDVKKVSSKAEEYAVPQGCVGIHKIIRRCSAIPVNYCVSGDRLVIKDYGDIDIFYKVLPETIDHATPLSYRFSVDIRTHGAIPFYIAYRIAENEIIATQCKDNWDRLNQLAKKDILRSREFRGI